MKSSEETQRRSGADLFFTGIEGTRKFFKIFHRSLEFALFCFEPSQSRSLGTECAISCKIKYFNKGLEGLNFAGKIHRRSTRWRAYDSATGVIEKIAQVISDINIAIKAFGIFGLIPKLIMPQYLIIKELFNFSICCSDIGVQAVKLHDYKELYHISRNKVRKWKVKNLTCNDSKKCVSKINQWKGEKKRVKEIQKRSYINLAFSISKIILTILSLIGLLITLLTMSHTFTFVALISSLGLSALGFGKFIWDETQ